MAYGDYIHCKGCDCKLIYDGYHDAREALQKDYDISEDDYTTPLLCPACLLLHTKRIAELEAENDALKQELASVLSDWNDLVQASGARSNGGAIGFVRAMRAERDALKALLRDVLAEYQSRGWLFPTEQRIKAAIAAKGE